MIELKETIKQSRNYIDQKDEYRFPTMKAAARTWISKCIRTNKLTEVKVKQAYNAILDLLNKQEGSTCTAVELKPFTHLLDALKTIEETDQILEHLSYQLEKRFTVKSIERSLELTRFHAKKRRKGL